MGFVNVSNDWFKCYLSDHSQYKSINGCDSGLAAINCGVSQWSVLGPLLFLLYINSTTSRCILLTFEQYGHPKECAQKVLVTLFPYIFCVKPKLNKVYDYLKTKNFSTDSISFPKCIEHQIFLDTQLQLGF